MLIIIEYIYTGTEAETLIEIKNLTKRYGKITAADNISFEFKPGQIYGFLGPNGAGKSTTMNIMTGCLSATEGCVLIDGQDISKNNACIKKLIGYLPETPPLYTEMTPNEYLCFVAGAKGVSRNKRDAEIARVMECTGITRVKDRLIANLSKGYRQRVGIAQALIGKPRYIILDEPTVGLDPNQMIEIRELIRSLGKEHTVILSSHILTEVSNICDTLIVISGGKIAASGSMEELRNKIGAYKKLFVTFKTDDSDAIQSIIRNVADDSPYTIETGLQTHVTIEDAEDGVQEKLFFAAADSKIPIIEMKMQTLSLEEIFTELTNKNESINEQKEDADAVGLQEGA